MVLPVQVVDRKPVARGILLDGRTFAVNKVLYSAALKGRPQGEGDIGYSLDIDAGGSLPQETHGFSSEDSAFQFLTSNDEKDYTVYDEWGNESTVQRRGLGVPSGMISYYEDTDQRRVTGRTINREAVAVGDGDNR